MPKKAVTSVKKKRYTFHMHTGKIVEGMVSYQPMYFISPSAPGHHKDGKPVNWSGERTKSCCGCFELTNIAGQFNYLNDFDFGPLKTDEEKFLAFKHFEQDLSKNNGAVIVYLVKDQVSGWMGKFVRNRKWLELPQFWNPKTHRILVPFYKSFHVTAPKPKGKTDFTQAPAPAVPAGAGNIIINI